VHDACSPDIMARSFVEAVQSDDCPSPALSTLTVDELVFDEPEVSTSIEYSIVSADVTSASSAARATNDPSTLAEGLSTALPADRLPAGDTLELEPGYATGQAAPPPRLALSATADAGSTMDADEGGSGWIILLVLFLFVLGGIGAGGFFYWRQTQELNPVLSTKEAFSNPMMVR
jgi:hypothetical protein